jgi:hypothetical protein
MTTRILFIVFNLVTSVFLIASIEGDHGHRTGFLGLLLFAGNLLFAFSLRRKRAVLPIAAQPGLSKYFLWSTWFSFLPVIAGALVFIVGLAQLSWKIALFGALAIGAGILRIVLRLHSKRILEKQK